MSEQMRVYPAGADPTAPDHLVANVWDADPRWTVVWYEGGERRGEMKKHRGYDPMSVKLHTGPDLPPKHTWVEPYTTDHIFTAPVSADARDIIVDATDGEGRSYRGFPATVW